MKSLLLSVFSMLMLAASPSLAGWANSFSSNGVNAGSSWNSPTVFGFGVPGSTSWAAGELYTHSAAAESEGEVEIFVPFIGPIEVPDNDDAAASSYSSWGVAGFATQNGFGGTFGFSASGSAGGGAGASSGDQP